ncbi:peptidoglycan editing factor PgeF [Sporosarcina sp. Marseille-Q4943]|uniref:peptidoglycan editing factor PgeF n=1 Tax=Sporosarcina sp. Marseille-Q4943 TaxID=2942204 RepID=UPI00208DB697|nr:peptidoglycan editing factor PgeF [Sporosarcina sp. Marseille-Q4943]
MKTKIYIDNEKFVAGTTLKDGTAPEHNNMAFHACVNPETVLENRKRLATFLQCNPKDFVCASQTHSANLHKVTLADKGRGAVVGATAIPDTDALYTTEPNLLLCSFTADCVPVIFYNEVNGIVGVIHSGWQGTVKEITLKVFERLKKEEGCDPSDFHVQLGMALSQEKFEVDEDVYVKFKALGYADEFIYFNEATNKYHIDNQKTVEKQLKLAGIPENQIDVDRTCTYVSSDGFSYRQDKQAGRHASFIMKKCN